MKLINLTLTSNRAVCVNVEQITCLIPIAGPKGNDGTEIYLTSGSILKVNEPFHEVVNCFTQLTTGKEARK